MAKNDVRIGIGTRGAAAAAAELDKLRDRFTSLQKLGAKATFGKDIQKGFTEGLGIGGALGAVNLVSTGVGALTGLIETSINAASDFNETVQKSGVVFGKSEGDIESWGKTSAKSMGLSENAAISAAASIGNLLLSTGTAPEKLAPMSKSIVQLASDLASFNNISVEDALAKLQSGLVGQERPLRELGVAISAASVDTEALALGFKKVNGVFTEGEKVQARYSLIFKQTTTAQGDFARTSSGMANQQRILSAEMEDFSVKLGQAVIPVVIELQGDLIKVIDAFDGVGDAAKNNADPLVNIANLIHDALKKPDEDPRTFLGALGTGLDEVNNNAGDAAAAINDFWTFWDSHSNLAERRAKRLGGAFAGMASGFSTQTGKMADDFVGLTSSFDTQAGKMKDDFVVVIQPELVNTAAKVEALASTTDTQAGKMKDDFVGIRAGAAGMASSMDTQTGKMKDDFVGVAKSAKGMANDFATAALKIQHSADATKDKLVDDAQSEIDKAFDPQIAHYKLVAAEAETTAAKKAAAAKGAGDAEKQAVIEAEKAEAEFLIASARAGDTSSKAFKKGVADLKDEIKHATGANKTYLQGVLDYLNAIDSVHATPTVTVKVFGAQQLDNVARQLGYVGNTDLYKRLPGNATPSPLSPHQLHLQRLGHLASGGAATAGNAYRVGEHGEETLVMGAGANGTVIPHGAAGAVGGTVNLTVNVQAAVGMSPAAARDIGNAVGPVIVDYLKRSGHLPRGAMPMHA